MPELPEVETLRLQLWQRLRGKSIRGAEVRQLKSVRNDQRFAEKITGLTVKDIDRVGKLLIISFKGRPDCFLLIHLKMTGQLFFVNGRGRREAEGGHETPHDHTLPNRHTRVIIHLKGDSTLYFNDQRIFGYLQLTDRAGLEAARQRFGPEPHAADFAFERFFEGLARSRQNIKARLLDQTFIAGLGNIYVDEALFRARIAPARPANAIIRAEAKKLMNAAAMVLKEAIKHGGTTFQAFRDASGQKGNYTRKLKVFGRQGRPCPRCGETIVKIRLAGRGTHYCPHCQH